MEFNNEITTDLSEEIRQQGHILDCQLTKTKPPADVARTVELLRDGKGIYGIGVAQDADVEDANDVRIVLRPDRLKDGTAGGTWSFPIYQRITGGFRHGMFSRSFEERLRQAIHHSMLNRAGLLWPPADSNFPSYWSNDEQQKTRNRKIYHGLRRSSLNIMNSLIGEALQEAAVPEAAIQARRFRFRYREDIYKAGATSARASQLIETFPTLAMAIYCGGIRTRYEQVYWWPEAQRLEASAMVERGVSLKRIAGFMTIPMALRRVKPGASDAALTANHDHEIPERLFHTYMPESLPKMKIWLAAIDYAAKVGPDYLDWTAKHALDTAATKNGALSFLEDTADWVRASYCAGVPAHVLRAVSGQAFEDKPNGDEFITRKFAANMSLPTVRQLSGEWHEAVAQNMDGPNIAFPAPWFEAASVDDHEILPITNSADLYREGKAMHHCVGTYADEVRNGEKYIFSLRKDGNRVATIEIVRYWGRAKLGQLRGACNSEVSESTKRLVRKWLRSQKPVEFPKPLEWVVVGSRDNDDDIPF